MNIIENAKKLATKAHEGQKRKYTGDDYIIHPEAVAKKIEMNGGTDEQIAAAWLHDTIEDCGLEFEDIKKVCGKQVAQYVLWLSDISKKEHGNRKIRKEIDAVVMALAPIPVKDIKLCDIIDNSKSILTHDPSFAKVYLKEKKRLLLSLSNGDKSLLKEARDIISGD